MTHCSTHHDMSHCTAAVIGRGMRTATFPCWQYTQGRGKQPHKYLHSISGMRACLPACLPACLLLPQDALASLPEPLVLVIDALDEVVERGASGSAILMLIRNHFKALPQVTGSLARQADCHTRPLHGNGKQQVASSAAPCACLQPQAQLQHAAIMAFLGDVDLACNCLLRVLGACWTRLAMAWHAIALRVVQHVGTCSPHPASAAQCCLPCSLQHTYMLSFCNTQCVAWANEPHARPRPLSAHQALRFVMTSRPDAPVVLALSHVFKPFVISQGHEGHTQDLRDLVAKELAGRLVVVAPAQALGQRPAAEPTSVGATQPASGVELSRGVELVVARSGGAFVYVARWVRWGQMRRTVAPTYDAIHD